MGARSWLSRRAASFSPSTIQQLSYLAQRCNAINLAEGFPDFPAPFEIKEAAVAAIRADLNQYRHVQGVCDKVAQMFERTQGIQMDPMLEITICCGQTEAMAAAIFAVIDEGDEVIVLDPAYDTYRPCIIMAGGRTVSVPLDPPSWDLDIRKLEAAITSRTKAIIINSPHNPTGKVMNTDDLAAIAGLCCKYDFLAITDEVYEHIVFDGFKHVTIATFPNMQERTIVTSSLSKTFSVTGWRIGWAIAPALITTAIQNIHVKLTDSAPAPFQEAAFLALQSNQDYFSTLRKDYEEKRDYICKTLIEADFVISLKPQGSFFVFAELPDYVKGNAVEYVTDLIKGAGVAMVPGFTFFHTENKFLNSTGGNNGDQASPLAEYASIGRGERLIRVAFCKSMSTLISAGIAILRHNKQLLAFTNNNISSPIL